MKNFLFDFGFNPAGTGPSSPDKKGGSRDQETDPQKAKQLRGLWTFFIYISLSLGIFLRRTVHFPDPLPGLNTTVFKWSVIAASFIIGLAILAPLLRIISKFNNGQLSWQHCLTAFSIGFFGDMAFDVIISNFVSVIRG